jgi:hypothetical protein
MRKLLATFLGLVLGAGAVVAIQSPAAASYGTCPSGTSCFYTDLYGEGAQMVLAYSVYGGGSCYNLSGTFNDSIDSVLNTWKSAHPIVVYSEPGCWGNYKVLTSFLTHNLTDMNNRTSSFRIR